MCSIFADWRTQLIQLNCTNWYLYSSRAFQEHLCLETLKGKNPFAFQTLTFYHSMQRMCFRSLSWNQKTYEMLLKPNGCSEEVTPVSEKINLQMASNYKLFTPSTPLMLNEWAESAFLLGKWFPWVKFPVIRIIVLSWKMAKIYSTRQLQMLKLISRRIG